MKSARLAAVAGDLPRRATARHAARIRSGVRTARPDVASAQLRTHAATTGRAKRDFRAHSAHIASWRPPQPASGAAPRPATLPALAPPGVGHGPMPFNRFLCKFRSPRNVRKRAGGAGRPGGVGQGEILRYLF